MIKRFSVKANTLKFIVQGKIQQKKPILQFPRRQFCSEDLQILKRLPIDLHEQMF